MQLGDHSYEKPELVLIAEKIYECKEHKRSLELELTDEEFHYKYIPRRESWTWREMRGTLILVVFLVFVAIVCLGMIIGSVRSELRARELGYEHNPADGIVVLLMSLAFIAVTIICVRLWMRISQILPRFIQIRKNKKQSDEADTFKKDKEQSRKKVEILKAQIEALDHEIDGLLRKQTEQEELLREKVNSEEKNNKQDNRIPSKAKFSIREESLGEAEILDVIECYEMEIQFYKNEIARINKEIEHTERNILKIDDEFDLIKRKTILFLVVFIFYIIIQNIFFGAWYTILSAIGLVGSSIYILYLSKIANKPVTEYLIEHDNKIVQDYIFRNNVVSLGKQRMEMLEEIERCNSEIEQLGHRKQIVESYLQ